MYLYYVFIICVLSTEKNAEYQNSILHTLLPSYIKPCPLSPLKSHRSHNRQEPVRSQEAKVLLSDEKLRSKTSSFFASCTQQWGADVRKLLHVAAIWGWTLKWWYSPTTTGFPTKNDHFGVFWGYHHLRKHPYILRWLGWVWSGWISFHQPNKTETLTTKTVEAFWASAVFLHLSSWNKLMLIVLWLWLSHFLVKIKSRWTTTDCILTIFLLETFAGYITTQIV